jgi:hypothetical protein
LFIVLPPLHIIIMLTSPVVRLRRTPWART